MDVEVRQSFPDEKHAADFDIEKIVTKHSAHHDVNIANEVLPHRKVHTVCRNCAWSEDGKLFAWACNEYTIQIMSADAITSNNQQIEDTLSVECNYPVTSLLFVSSNETVQDCGDNQGYQLLRWRENKTVMVVGMKSGRVRVINVRDGSILLELIDHKDHVSSLSVSPSLILVSASYDGTIKFWDLADDGNMFHSFLVANYTACRGVRHKVLSVAWSPDGARVATTGTFKAVVIFDMRNKEPSLTLSGHVNRVNRCQFSPDGTLLVSSSVDTTCIVWNSYTGVIICRLGHQFPEPCPWFPGESDTDVLDCAFSKTGLQVVTAADDGYLRFWDLHSPNSPVSICAVDNPLCCSFNQNGGFLAVGSTTGDLVIVQPTRTLPSLLQLCRLACNTSQHIQYDSVDKLVIPTTLKNYLRYDSF